jgi:hypothetical protein
MASLDPPAALTAPADVDVELPVDGFARILDLELLSNMPLVEQTTAVGAAVKQRCLSNFIDLPGGGRLAVGLGPVLFAGLAAGLLGLAGGRALGERAAWRLPARVASSSWRPRQSFSACRSRRRR